MISSVEENLRHKFIWMASQLKWKNKARQVQSWVNAMASLNNLLKAVSDEDSWTRKNVSVLHGRQPAGKQSFSPSHTLKVPATIAKKEVKNSGAKIMYTSSHIEPRKGTITKGRVRNPVKLRKIVKVKRRSGLPESTIEETRKEEVGSKEIIASGVLKEVNAEEMGKTLRIEGDAHAPVILTKDCWREALLWCLKHKKRQVWGRSTQTMFNILVKDAAIYLNTTQGKMPKENPLPVNLWDHELFRDPNKLWKGTYDAVHMWYGKN